MNRLQAQLTYVNRSEDVRVGETDVYETFTSDRGKLFRSLQREHGRCKGKVYIDTDQGSRPIGWVFQKRVKYTDCNETYLAETWVTLHKSNPTRSIEYDYDYLQ